MLFCILNNFNIHLSLKMINMFYTFHLVFILPRIIWKITKIVLILQAILSYVFVFGVTLNSAQCLLLPLCSGNTPGALWGTMYVTGMKLWRPHAKQIPDMLSYLASPVFNTFWKIRDQNFNAWKLFILPFSNQPLMIETAYGGHEIFTGEDTSDDVCDPQWQLTATFLFPAVWGWPDRAGSQRGFRVAALWVSRHWTMTWCWNFQ